MIIALDAMGGDLAPTEIVQGAMLAAPELDAQVALVGAEDQIRSLLGGSTGDGKLFVRAASEVVGMEDSARVALRQKPDSSVAQAVNMVVTGEAQACVSAGHSGAFMGLCHTRLKTIPGILRPAIALLMPTPSGPRVLLDAGANVDCKPTYLQQFGIMGSVYAQFALGMERPRVALLSIGSEACKGNELTRAAAELLATAPVNFVGNVEGDQLFGDSADVIVCDGFVGNVLLKVAEGLAGMVLAYFRQGITSSVRARLGAVLMRDVLAGARRVFDYGTYGGALLLGVNGICVVCHGKSDANAIRNALLVAQRSVKARIVEHVREACLALCPAEEAVEASS